ncbi:ubiquitin carboxyl-terminal hydrolase, putative [Trypanosoma brucei brucei TREU927]|uniref:ubiquitinyl hydrolase 1 n=1 Tax=Trypanosoma brucei brucei (strain 927/4 GUTat10.1) TaxID=185431 RepID=Q38D19_TRYB2|nr:ubiquitin carboxyl-terminal hydrolase, putative [Trypanosoma brucei brucei TREU927]EAN77301.1 ubiquitin carboxyl-terminal hydrolase, putative [Trypanosoma brucei brucei TREU927]
MLQVLGIVKHIFWNDAMYDRSLLPSEASMEKCHLTWSDLAAMTGRNRVALLAECGIHHSLNPVFMRAIHHVTSRSGSGCEGFQIVHTRLSARLWSPSLRRTSLLAPTVVNSDIFVDGKAEGIISDETVSSNAVNEHKRRRTKYNGLLNQGATCYLNSLLQTLFHISEFRLAIYQIPTAEEAEEKNDVNIKATKSIPYALQRLFCHLQTGSEAADTTELTESFGWSSSDSFVQHDVHELTCELLDKLENKLGGVRKSDNGFTVEEIASNAISRLFVGILESFVRVGEVGYYGAKEQLFYDIQLVVKNTTDIYASLDKFFQVEVLDGKNKYCLEHDGQKTYHCAEKGVRLKLTPPILILHLTRFDYDPQKGETKVLSRWVYYHTLDLSKYVPHASLDEVHYTLCSVLVHSGSNAGFGHYFCFIWCSDAWYRFNDGVVSQASLRDVFETNFGGSRINYWGSQVPSIANAYMLVYIRTSQLKQMLRPVELKDVPLHVAQQLEREREEREKRLREKAEDHLYGRIHFIEPHDIVAKNEFLSCRRPAGAQFPSQRTLRVLLSSEALPAFNSFVDDKLGVRSSEQTLWYVASKGVRNRFSLHRRVSGRLAVSDVLGGDKECCVLVVNAANAHCIEVDGDEELEHDLIHHKVYTPMQLKVHFVGCTVISRKKRVEFSDVFEKMESFVRSAIAGIADDVAKTRDHHLTGVCLKSVEEVRTPTVAPFLPLSLGGSGYDRDINKSVNKLTVLIEDEQGKFLSSQQYLQSGDTLIWQEETPGVDARNIFYSDIVSFQHFLRRRIPVEIKLNSPPSYPTLVDAQLADDMTYEQLQRYVARLIGQSDNYDRVRFTMYNPETRLPYFMKGRRSDRSNLTRLLSPPVQRSIPLSKILYYEYCKYTVTEIEAAHSLQFKLFGSCVRPIGEYWVLMPREEQITPKALFGQCVKEISDVRATESVNSLAVSQSVRSDREKEPQTGEMTQSELNYYASLDPQEAWRTLRLVDVWCGRIYNVFDKDHAQTFNRSTFEESAEYRIEELPKPIDGVPPQNQSIIQVHHFTLLRNRANPVDTHGNPFSIYIGHDEMAPSLLQRIAMKLGLSEAAVVDWKMALVKEDRVLEVLPTVAMGKQLFDFCDEHHYQPNKQPPTKMAFLGLEHAPLSKRCARKEDKVVIHN